LAIHKLFSAGAVESATCTVLSRGDAIFTSAVEYFTPEGFFIASEAVGLLGSMLKMKFNGWQWIFVEFSLLS